MLNFSNRIIQIMKICYHNMSSCLNIIKQISQLVFFKYHNNFNINKISNHIFYTVYPEDQFNATSKNIQ